MSNAGSSSDGTGRFVLRLLPLGMGVMVAVDAVLGESAEYFNAWSLLRAWGNFVTGSGFGGHSFVAGQERMGDAASLGVGSALFVIEPAVVLTALVLGGSAAHRFLGGTMRKTITIDQQITIAASPGTVFAWACDYRNDPSWRSGVREMSIDSDGNTRAGDHTREVMRVLGRTTRTEAVITAHDPRDRTAFRTVAGDLTAHGYRQTQSAGDETVFTYHAEAVLDRPLRLLARPIEWLFNRRAARDVRALAELLAHPTEPLWQNRTTASSPD